MDVLDERLHLLVDELGATGPAPRTSLARTARTVRRRRRRRTTRVVAAGIAVAVVFALVAVVVVRDDASTNRIESPATSSAPTGTRLGVDDGREAYVLHDLDDGTSRSVPLANRRVGDFPYQLLRVDDWLVYMGEGVQAQPVGISGTTVSLGPASWFVPSARDGWIWLVTARGDEQSPETVQEARVDGTDRGSPLELPAGMTALVGVDGGLLVGNDTTVVARWDQATGAVGAPLVEGTVGLIDARADTVAWSLGCGSESTCSLRVLDLATGSQRDVDAPSGRVGWIPAFHEGSHDALSPDGRHLAVRTAPDTGASRPTPTTLYVIDLDTGDVREVPESANLDAYSRIAWSPDGRWLFHETAGHQIGAYDTGTTHALTYAGSCCGAALVTMSTRSTTPTTTTTSAPTATVSDGTDVTTLQPTFEQSIQRLETWYHNWPAEAPGGRPVLAAEWTYCDYRGNPDLAVIPGAEPNRRPDVEPTFSSYSKLSEPLTATRLADGCIQRTDRFPGGTPANVPIETPDDQLPPYLLCATDQAGPNHTGAPPAQTVVKPAIVFAGTDCAAAGYQDPPPDFLTELDRRRHVEIELRAVPKACPTSAEALAWVRHVTQQELGEAWLTGDGGPETCYRPAYIDWDNRQTGLMTFTPAQAGG